MTPYPLHQITNTADQAILLTIPYHIPQALALRTHLQDQQTVYLVLALLMRGGLLGKPSKTENVSTIFMNLQ